MPILKDSLLFLLQVIAFDETLSWYDRMKRDRIVAITIHIRSPSVIKRTMGRLIGYSNGNTRLEKHRWENDKTILGVMSP